MAQDQNYGGPDKNKGGGGPKGGTYVADKDKKGGGGGNNDPDDMRDDLPKAFLNKLDALGLKVTKGGKITKKGGASGAGIITDQKQLALMQQGWNKFGLTNDAFNPKLVAFTGELHQGPGGKVGTFVNLATGLDQFGGLVSDEELALYQAQAGWNIQDSVDWYAQANTITGSDGSTYTGYAFSDPDRAAALFSATRAVAMNQAGASTPGTEGVGPPGSENWNAKGWVNYDAQQGVGQEAAPAATPGPSMAGGFDFDAMGNPLGDDLYGGDYFSEGLFEQVEE